VIAQQRMPHKVESIAQTSQLGRNSHEPNPSIHIRATSATGAQEPLQRDVERGVHEDHLHGTPAARPVQAE
jgi:hypothetical protein